MSNQTTTPTRERHTSTLVCENGHTGPFVCAPVDYMPGSDRDATGEGWLGRPLVCAACRAKVSGYTVSVATDGEGAAAFPEETHLQQQGPARLVGFRGYPASALLSPAVCCPRCGTRPPLSITYAMAIATASLPAPAPIGVVHCARPGCDCWYDVIAADYALAATDGHLPRRARDVTADLAVEVLRAAAGEASPKERCANG